MKPRKTALICISDLYLTRGLQLRDYYLSRNDEVRLLTIDFSHRDKKPITNPPEGVTLLHHRPYQKNLSWQRLLGHYEFARACRKDLEEWKPNRIHCLVPANSLARQMGLYKKAHPEVQLIFDLNDLWPESLPIHGFEKTPPARIWRHLRNEWLPEADLVFAECGLFAQTIEQQTGIQAKKLYWSADLPDLHIDPHPDPEIFSLCYLGSVNNIIDLDWLESLLRALSAIRPVTLHLMASGEKKPELMERAGKYATVIDHGLVYEPQARQDIFDLCHYGLNIMKDNVRIGLSMKSIDYLAGGLPLINSLHGDIEEWIDQYDCGINIDRQSPSKTAANIEAISPEKHQQMRQAARTVYEEWLSKKVFERTLDQALDALDQKRLLPEENRKSETEN